MWVCAGVDLHVFVTAYVCLWQFKMFSRLFPSVRQSVSQSVNQAVGQSVGQLVNYAHSHRTTDLKRFYWICILVVLLFVRNQKNAACHVTRAVSDCLIWSISFYVEQFQSEYIFDSGTIVDHLSMGRVSRETTNTIFTVDRVHSMNIYSWISSVQRGCERNEWPSPWTKWACKLCKVSRRCERTNIASDQVAG